MRFSFTTLLVTGVLVAGCNDGGGTGATDAGRRVDGGARDGGGVEVDAGRVTDAGGADAATPSDGGRSDGGGDSDGGRSDGGTPFDAGQPDAGPPGSACGTRGAPPCMRADYCEFPLGECGRSDRGGTCRPRPEGCPDIWDPVCGCDGSTYSNACDAAASGVSIASAGECEAAAGGSCDVRLIRCRRLPPLCEAGTYGEVDAESGCWTDRCITLGECTCTSDLACPSMSCDAAAMRCQEA